MTNIRRGTFLIIQVLFAFALGCGTLRDPAEPLEPPGEETALEPLVTSAAGQVQVVGLFGRCMTVWGPVAAGSAIAINDCDSAQSKQFWVRTALNQFKVPSQNLCVRSHDHSSTSGTDLELGTCTTGSQDAWTKDGLFLRGPGSKCMTVTNGQTANGTPLELQTCTTGTPSKEWFFPDSTIEVRVHIVLMANDDGSNPATVTPTQFKGWVDSSNSIFYSRIGLKLVFSDANPSPDVSNWNNSLINAPISEGGPNYPAQSAAVTAYSNNLLGKAVFFLIKPMGAGGVTLFPSTGRGLFFNGSDPGSQWWPFVPHELGHYFGLGHTFGPTPDFTGLKSTLESNGGSLAPYDGDVGNVSDTPPDPGAGAWPSGSDPCTTNLDVTLNSGQVVQVRPNKRNIMSYWGCDPNLRSITPQQINVVRTTLLTHAARSDISNDSMPNPATGVGTLKTMDNRPELFAGGNRIAVKYKLSSDPNSAFTQWIPMATAATTAMAGVNLSNGAGQVWGVTASGGLTTTWQNAGGGWEAWTDMSVPIVVRDIATSHTTDSRARLYVAGTNGQIKVTEKTTTDPLSPWSSWQDLSHTTSAKALSVGILQTGAEQIFMVGTDGVLYSRYQGTPGGAWSSWLTMTAPTLADIDAGYATDGRLKLFGIDSTGKMVTAEKQTTDPLSFWTLFSDLNSGLVGFSSVSSFRLQDGRPQVTGIRSGVIWTTWWTGSAWSAWVGM